MRIEGKILGPVILARTALGACGVAYARENQLVEVENRGVQVVAIYNYPLGQPIETPLKRPDEWFTYVRGLQSELVVIATSKGPPESPYPLSFSAYWELVKVGVYDVEGGWYRADEPPVYRASGLQRPKSFQIASTQVSCPSHILKDLVNTVKSLITPGL